MSALTPSNGKYRSMWSIYGKQMANKEMLKKVREGYDKIKWGTESKKFKEVETNLPGYTKIVYTG